MLTTEPDASPWLRFKQWLLTPFVPESLLSVVHGLKVLMKEDFTPTGADSVVFTWAPVVTRPE